ncbi:hypothetical protein BT93_I0542 [Corymbia citriodora subsp. variegata]|nr:hypothetical protein BT93_I0542 [Corymbia citriodora subsp. variegata]
MKRQKRHHLAMTINMARLPSLPLAPSRVSLTYVGSSSVSRSCFHFSGFCSLVHLRRAWRTNAARGTRPTQEDSTAHCNFFEKMKRQEHPQFFYIILFFNLYFCTSDSIPTR